MRFRNSVIRMSGNQKMKMLGGNLAIKMARRSGDPLARQYDDLKSRLEKVKENIRIKYRSKALRRIRKS